MPSELLTAKLSAIQLFVFKKKENKQYKLLFNRDGN